MAFVQKASKLGNYFKPDTPASKLSNYVSKSDIKTLHDGFSATAEVIKEANAVMKFLNSDETKQLLTKFLPKIASQLSKVASFASFLGPAGVAVSLVVDILSIFGIFSTDDQVMKLLEKISNQIEELRDDIKQGFKEIKTKLDTNLILGQFLAVRNKVAASVEIYEQNVAAIQALHEKRSKADEELFYQRLADMVRGYPPNEVIHDLKLMHNIITGKTYFAQPLFNQVAEEMIAVEGDDFDKFMVTLFSQFQLVIALQIRAVRMLRSFLVFTETEQRYGIDLEAIFTGIGKQRRDFNPASIFDWYINFKLKGGTFEIRCMEPSKVLFVKSNHYVYGKFEEPGISAHFTLKPVEGGAFLVSSQQYPDNFMRLESDEDNGDVTSTTDLNDIKCHWYFHVKDMQNKVFKLCTEKWPQRYIYFKDGDNYVMAAPFDRMDKKKAQFMLIPFEK